MGYYHAFQEFPGWWGQVGAPGKEGAAAEGEGAPPLWVPAGDVALLSVLCATKLPEPCVWVALASPGS